MQAWVAFMLAPLSAMSTMIDFACTSVVFAKEPVIVIDAPQSVQRYDLSFSTDAGSTAGLDAIFAIYAVGLGPSST